MLSYVTNYQHMALHLLRPLRETTWLWPQMENFLIGCQFHLSFTLVSPRGKYPKNESFRPKSSVSLFCDGNGGITDNFQTLPHRGETPQVCLLVYRLRPHEYYVEFKVIPSHTDWTRPNPWENLGSPGKPGEKRTAVRNTYSYVPPIDLTMTLG